MKITYCLPIYLTEATIDSVVNGLNNIKHIESVNRVEVGFKQELHIIVPDDYTVDNALVLGTLIGGIEAKNALS